MKRYFGFLIMVGLLLAFPAPVSAQETVDYWPTDGWRVSTPEEQGMNPDLLARLLEYLSQQPNGPNIHNVLVIRNGYIVLDASVPPFTTDDPHALYSATKAVVSTLAGVAQQQGYIQGPDQSIWDFLNQADYANMDEAKQSLTLEDFMTQRSGLGLHAGVGVPFDEADDIRMYEMRDPGADWLKFVLDFPMDSDPGERFRYTDSNPYVVTALIREATGQPVEQFADEALFGPLGITNSIWAVSPQGIAWGGDGLLLSAHDLAKIGFLYMNGGQWAGQQILSPAWIEAAWTDYFTPHYLDGYGFYWYVYERPSDAERGYAAIGLEGQFLWVYPELNLIFVTNGDTSYVSKTLCDVFLFRAIEGDAPIPADPEGTAHLETALAAFTNPIPVAVTAMPEAATALNGKVYGLPDNSWGWETVGLNFGTDDATLTLDVRGEQLTLPVDLDRTYAMSDASWPVDHVWQYVPDVPLTTRGWWQGNSEFHVSIRSTYGIQEYELIWKRIAEDGTTLRFEANELGTGPILAGQPSNYLELTAQE